MPETVEGKIAAALMAHVALISGGYAVAYPNVQFKPPLDEQGNPEDYLEVNYLPNGSVYEPMNGAGLSDQGILQLSLVQQSGKGTIDPRDACGNIAVHFTKDTVIYGEDVRVKIYSSPVVSGSSTLEGETRTPITIQYRTIQEQL